MIYFDLKTKSFSELSNDNTYPIESQDDINTISASITGGGAVWIENGKIKCSGKAPSEFHVFNMETKNLKFQKKNAPPFYGNGKQDYYNALQIKPITSKHSTCKATHKLKSTAFTVRNAKRETNYRLCYSQKSLRGAMT